MRQLFFSLVDVLLGLSSGKISEADLGFGIFCFAGSHDHISAADLARLPNSSMNTGNLYQTFLDSWSLAESEGRALCNVATYGQLDLLLVYAQLGSLFSKPCYVPLPVKRQHQIEYDTLDRMLQECNIQAQRFVNQ